MCPSIPDWTARVAATDHRIDPKPTDLERPQPQGRTTDRPPAGFQGILQIVGYRVLAERCDLELTCAVPHAFYKLAATCAPRRYQRDALTHCGIRGRVTEARRARRDPLYRPLPRQRPVQNRFHVMERTIRPPTLNRKNAPFARAPMRGIASFSASNCTPTCQTSTPGS
jgi:hypothetical protein